MLNSDKVHFREGTHWVSPFDFDPEVQSQFDWPKPLALIDSTLRKTLFTAGALTSMNGFVRIAEALAEAGVRDESLNVNWAGGPAPTPRELALCRTIAGRDFGFKLNVYADTLLSDGEHHRRSPRDRRPSCWWISAFVSWRRASSRRLHLMPRNVRWMSLPTSSSWRGTSAPR